MPRTITLTPDANGQLHLECDGEELVVTIARETVGGPPGVSADPPIQGGRPRIDPFNPWKHNTQLVDRKSVV